MSWKPLLPLAIIIASIGIFGLAPIARAQSPIESAARLNDAQQENSTPPSDARDDLATTGTQSSSTATDERENSDAMSNAPAPPPVTDADAIGNSTPTPDAQEDADALGNSTPTPDAQEDAPQAVESTAVYRQISSYIEGLDAIAESAKRAADDPQACNRVARDLAAYAEKHRNFRQELGYATERVSDKEIAVIMNKAREIGKKLAICYGSESVDEFLSRMAEQE